MNAVIFRLFNKMNDEGFICHLSLSITFNSIEVFIHFNFENWFKCGHIKSIFHLYPQQLAIKQYRNIMVLNNIEASLAH